MHSTQTRTAAPRTNLHAISCCYRAYYCLLRPHHSSHHYPLCTSKSNTDIHRYTPTHTTSPLNSNTRKYCTRGAYNLAATCFDTSMAQRVAPLLTRCLQHRLIMPTVTLLRCCFTPDIRCPTSCVVAGKYNVCVRGCIG